ncbi:ExeA family protein [Nitrosomonas ureae]|uniref:General secretion pathway protein A n=1 Tax=Nitrosomonas ureae TaxID=44577 RepID=A0A1H9BHK4_9PROT|nr:AAA family ATPase [Nitrosomonas ureae]PXX17647.1 general secretion pathway protein A [Nitrosomonas ureae]SEP88349.1 general secretion pathway protein A [Nitrosomonas ureae]SOD20642.1 general secretion pathway protein A [Nitrosomonas ureae]
MHMYAQHFNLKLLPFENVPDPLFFYDHGDHARIRKQISGSLQSGRGLIVVTGPIGSGKTTLSQMIKADFPESIQLIWMAEPPANSTDLYLFLAQELGLQPTSSEKTFVMRDIRNALMTINTEGKKCLVIIDESHLMSEDVLNGIRLLNNLEEGSIKLIQLLLLGQDELMEKINKPEMIPFKQRIAALESLGKMTTDGVLKYITHRIQVAGGNPNLISATGWEAISIAFSAGGTPRTINSLCDRSFNVAYERNKSVIDAKDVYEATQRMGLITDVFHYIIMLNNEERKKQESQDIADQSVQETVVPKTTSSTEQPPSPNIKKAEQKINPIMDEIPVIPRAKIDISDKSYDEIANAIKAKYEQKNLQISVALLLVSLTTFLISIFYFCHRSDSDGLLECLTHLLSF